MRRCHVFYHALTGSKTPPQNSEKARKFVGGSTVHKSPTD
ncbi:spermidine/putrescine ABC transporter ATP-binding protein [Bacillus sp. dmp10]|nr:spermidine/putrescine ABC transporter ATP-binding protein [Bacillus sp. dmp10]